MLSITGVAAERPPSAMGMDVAARFNVAVGTAAIAAERHGIWIGFLRRYTEAVEIPKMPSLNAGKWGYFWYFRFCITCSGLHSWNSKTLARCCSAHLQGCDTPARLRPRRRCNTGKRRHLLHAQEHAASLRHCSYLSFPIRCESAIPFPCLRFSIYCFFVFLII